MGGFIPRLFGSASGPQFSTVGLAVATAANAVAAHTALGIPNPAFRVALKNITILTTGAPADIGSIALPSWLTRWCIPPLTLIDIIAETASGTLAAGTLALRDAANGAGQAVSNTLTPPTAAAGRTSGAGAAAATTAFSTSGTIYIRQTANSANAGTISVYVTLVPLL